MKSRLNKSLTIASVQMPVSKKKTENLKIMENYLKHISNLFPNVNIVVFPELSPTSIGSEPHDEAEKIPGSLTSTFSSWSKKYNIWLIPGSIYELFNGKVYNSTPVFSPDGSLVGVYKKRYPWSPYEKTESGSQPFVFKIKNFGIVGIMICYDLWFPEVARDLTNLGAELIIVPTMTTTGDRNQEKILSRATAITQQCYLVSCNGVGFGGVGGSHIIDPEGLVLQENGEGPCIQTSVIDFEHVQKIREIGTAGVTTPHKAFKNNKQSFKVYNK